MNALDLYKRLPRKNCGKCRVRACMPFSFAVVRGEAEPEECPLLSPEDVAELKKAVTRSDWREELIRKLGDEVGTLSFSDIADGLGASLRDGNLVLTCMGREFTVSPAGEIRTPGRVTPWIKILLLHYIKTAGKGGLGGKWVSYGELRGGIVKASSFLRDCERPLSELFDRDALKAGLALLHLGAQQRSDFPSPCAFHLLLLPRVPVVILYWQAEEEFPSRLKILFDASADRYLDAESLIFLVEGLVKNIEHLIEEPAAKDYNS